MLVTHLLCINDLSIYYDSILHCFDVITVETHWIDLKSNCATISQHDRDTYVYYEVGCLWSGGGDWVCYLPDS